MEVKVNQGRLWKNERKTEERHPDYTGFWTDESGTEYYLSGWKNQDKSGKTSLSLKLGKAKDQAYAPPAKPKAQPSDLSDMDDDIQF
jgi:hypothetical protein